MVERTREDIEILMKSGKLRSTAERAARTALASVEADLSLHQRQLIKAREYHEERLSRVKVLYQKVSIIYQDVYKRQEQNYLLGLQAFMERVSARYIVPMHFGPRTEVFQWLRQDPRTKEYRARIIESVSYTHLFSLAFIVRWG